MAKPKEAKKKSKLDEEFSTLQDSGCAKGDKFRLAAFKKKESFGWFGLKKQQNYEEAGELFVKAAIAYKIGKFWDLAGWCYGEAAWCNMSSDNEIDAKSNWRESGKCYRHSNYKKSIESYKECIQMNLDNDRFGQAAKLEEEIGDMLAEDEHYNEAVEAYEQSAEYYDADNDTVNRNKRLLKVAKMSAKAQKYEKGIKIFKDIAKSCSDNQLLRWKVREYCFNGMILEILLKCQIEKEGKKDAGWDVIEDIHDSYKNISNLYDGQRECKLIDQIISSIKDGKKQDFKDAIAYFDKISKLDNWTTNLLLEIEHYFKYLENKKHEINENDLFEDDNNNNNNNNNNDDQKENENLKNDDDNAPNDNDNVPDIDGGFDGAPDADML